MPNRILRDWTDSFVIDELDVNAERFFVRLIMKVDDYGRLFADARLLRANLFPLKTDIRDTDISRWLTACEKAGLIAIYNVATKEFLQITNFKQTLRQKKVKYPPPDTCNASDTHTHSMCIANAPPERKQKGNESETRVETEKEIFHPPDLSKSNLFREPVIPTKKEVLESFVQNGGDKEMAKSFWDRNESTGWYFKGSPITNFRNMVNSYVSNWKKNSKDEINTENAGITRKLEEEKANAILNS